MSPEAQFNEKMMSVVQMGDVLCLLCRASLRAVVFAYAPIFKFASKSAVIDTYFRILSEPKQAARFLSESGMRSMGHLLQHSLEAHYIENMTLFYKWVM